MLKNEVSLNSGVQRICPLHSSVSHGKIRYRLGSFYSYVIPIYNCELCIAYINYTQLVIVYLYSNN